MKIVNRSSLNAMSEKALRREINILTGFNHPNILRLIETYTTIQKHFLVTEILEGGELFDRIVEKSVYTEEEARDLSKTLIETMEYCHLRQVAHRDLKVSTVTANISKSSLVFQAKLVSLFFFSPRISSLKVWMTIPKSQLLTLDSLVKLPTMTLCRPFAVHQCIYRRKLLEGNGMVLKQTCGVWALSFSSYSGGVSSIILLVLFFHIVCLRWTHLT